MTNLTLTLDEYLAIPKGQETWLIESILPKGGTVLLYGDPKVGKSFAALQLAASLAVGDSWLGFGGPKKPCKVVYVQLDTPRSLWGERLSLLAAGGLFASGSQHRSSTDHLHSDNPSYNPCDPEQQHSSSTGSIRFADRQTLDAWPFDIMNPDHAVKLALASDGADVIIMDTLRESHRLDENDSTDMQNVVSQLTAAVKPAALVLISHGRKGNAETGPSLINDNRGSNYVVGAVDAILHFTHKGLQVGGRAIEETDIKLDRLSNGLWQVAESRERIKMLARELLAQDFESNRARSRVLAELTGQSEESCRKVLDRMSS